MGRDGENSDDILHHNEFSNIKTFHTAVVFSKMQNLNCCSHVAYIFTVCNCRFREDLLLDELFSRARLLLPSIEIQLSPSGTFN